MEKMFDILFRMLTGLLQTFKTLEKAQGKNASPALVVMKTPGVRACINVGDDIHGSKMNVFGGIKGLLMLIGDSDKESVFDEDQRANVLERLISLRSDLPADEQVKEALEETISAFAG